MILGAAVTIGFFGLLATMIFRVIPTENQQVVNIMIGSLGTAWISIVNYYFGSSAGSAAKSLIIDAMAKK